MAKDVSTLRNRGMLRILCALVCMLFCACESALALENLLRNPEIAVADGTASGWESGAWDESRSFLETDNDGMDGNGGFYIVNLVENDARFMQTVAVEPETVYHLSCYVKAEGCEGGAGANISVANAFSYSDGVYDTQGEWVLTEMYGITGKGQTELTVYLRLGGYSATTVGEAWFDNVTLEKIETVPADVNVQPLYSTVTSQQQEKPAISAEAKSTAVLACTAVVFALAGGLCYVFGSRSVHGGLDNRGKTSSNRIWVLLAAALMTRIVLALFVRGFDTDINCFLAWSSRVYQTGFGNFYTQETFCDYPPGYIAVLWLVGALRALFGQMDGGVFAVLLVKLPNIFADVLACLLLYRFAESRISERGAIVLTSLYALNPAVILDSAGWGQTDGLLSLLLIGALVLASSGKWMRCLAVYALAVLVKPQALLFAPLGIMVLGIEFARSEDKPRTAKHMLGGIALALAIWVGLSMPFAISQVSESMPGAPTALQPVIWLFEKYFNTLGSYSYYTVSACNFWDLIGLNWVEIAEGTSQWLGWAAYAAAFVFALVMYIKAKSGKKIYLIGAAMLSIMFAFGLKMHERYIFPAIILLCFAYGEDQDVRIPFAMIMISCAQLVNMGLVLVYYWTTHAPVWIVKCTDVVVLAACALLIWTCIDLCVREHVIGITRIYKPSKRRLEIQEEQAKKATGSGMFTEPSYKMGIDRKEWLVVACVTALYSVFTFVNLGTLSAPETSWTSSQADEQIVFDLGEERRFMLTYYGGICNTTFTVEFSSDGEHYTEPHYAQYDQGEIFRWLWYRPMTYYDDSGEQTALESEYTYRTARYVRLTACQPGLVLSEVAFLSEDGNPWPIVSVTTGGSEDPLSLIDEQETVPDHPSYYNSSYFDEIYHVRTAYEHIHGMHTYEWTHPPLGKLLIAVGILIFGMCPFGWRFMGALSGVLMVPLTYLLMRQISKSKLAAFFAMMLMTLDCMHFTQTRLGTIDSFSVMFIMCMYLSMFRYVRMSFYHDSLPKTLVPLALCGISFALGCATKWICIYAGAGLAVLFFYTLVRRYLEYRYASAGMRAFAPEEKKIAQRAAKNFWRYAVTTCLFCCAFFIVIPLVTYYFSYYWQLTPDGNFNIQSVVSLQKTMFNYHNGLGNDDHFFRSPWYEWPLIVKPMWYYSGNAFVPSNMVSSISCMGNPAVWWGGLLSLFYVLFRFVNRRGRDRESLMLLIGFLSQYLPWVLVPRSTFIYHYFASVPFIILCAAVVIEDIELRSSKAAKWVSGIWIGAAAMLCAAFYPLMSGTPVLRSYAKYLRWFHWYNY